MTNATAAAEQKLRLGSLAFFDEGAAEMDRHHRRVFVPRHQVNGLRLTYASGAQQPLVALLVALLVLVAPLYSLLYLIDRLRYGGYIHSAMLWGLVFSAISVWLIHFALKRRFVVVALTQRGGVKLLVDSSVPPAAIEPFLNDVASRFGYPVEVDNSARQKLRALL